MSPQSVSMIPGVSPSRSPPIAAAAEPTLETPSIKHAPDSGRGPYGGWLESLPPYESLMDIGMWEEHEVKALKMEEPLGEVIETISIFSYFFCQKYS